MQNHPPLIFSVCLLTLALSVSSQKTEEADASRASGRVKKRSYELFPWPLTARSNPPSLYNAGNYYKPATYTIPRPYYIPVYGTQGGQLIHYPPQPIYVNIGHPVDNPPYANPMNYPPYNRPPYQAPAYLPPSPPEKPTATEKPSSPVDRFGGFDDDDDRPVWDSNSMVQMPLNGGSEKESSVVPTRPPTSSSKSLPSLVHSTQSDNPGANAPPPPASTGPSNCVWAIISCCSAGNPDVIAQNCFEQRGCPGPFWGDSPCKSDFARAAIEAAMKYYESN